MQCTPWKDRSCCTKEITESLHINATWYNFNWNHCPQPLSPKCKGRFQQDLCFYECSPNVGPWLVKVRICVSLQRPNSLVLIFIIFNLVSEEMVRPLSYRNGSYAKCVQRSSNPAYADRSAGYLSAYETLKPCMTVADIKSANPTA